MSKQRRLAWLILILLVASFLRLHDLPQVPPGMTHDEADHGLDAWGVVQGDRPLYFTVGYGREPLFDYSTAVLMSFLGPSYLAGRLTAVFFSLILLAGSYAWTRHALGPNTALLATAGLATGFWPLMTARQALRSITMPALFVLAAVFYWRGWQRYTERENGAERPFSPTPSNLQSLIPGLQCPSANFLLAGLFLGLTFYTYVPARLTWVAFPALLLYLLVARPQPLPWRGTAAMLLLAGLLSLPLFVFLATTPGAETRIDQLAEPLRAAARGELGPLWANAREGVGIFTMAGDSQWRYNVAGRPLLTPMMGILFYVGVGLSALRATRGLSGKRQEHEQSEPAHFFALSWLLLGLSPVLVTGTELSTTQAIGMQPVLYLFPALSLTAVAGLIRPLLPQQHHWLLPAAAILLFMAIASNTRRTYFVEWANRPEVAVQYEQSLVETINYLNEQGAGAVAISTDAPDRFHDPATAQLFLTNDAVSLRWFDGRHSLLVPQTREASILITEAAPLHPSLASTLQAATNFRATAGPTDLIYRVNHNIESIRQLYPQFSTEFNSLSTELSTEIMFGSTVQFLGADLPETRVRPGDTVQVATLWRIARPPEEVLVLFTHALDARGRPMAQADRLDVPSVFWQTGDVFIQRHELTLPTTMPSGKYPLAIGFYRADEGQDRLPITVGETSAGALLRLPPLIVTE